MLNNNSNRKKKILKLILFIIFLILCYIYETNIGFENKEVQKPIEINEEIGELTLTMIDVGQADSFLLQQGNQVALIDCGTRSTGKDVVKYLKEHEISKIDYLFGTHPHDDHMGGMYDVITNFDIEKVIIPEVEKGKVTSNWYLKLMNELSKEHYRVEYAKVGQTYYLGKATINVIGPISEEPSNVNNYSTVLKVSFGEMDVIMTGDAETSVEKEILQTDANLDAEILKMGHHGSDTSSSKEFLDAISPDYALISVGTGNKFKHPCLSTMNNLKDRNIKVYRTDESGTVILNITSNDVKFSCEPGDYLDGVEHAKGGK